MTPPYRRPDFDPNLLAAFRQAVSDHNQCYEETRTRTRSSEDVDLIEAFEPPRKVARTESENNLSVPLADFEVKCPTGGKQCVILYTTSLRGIRKTFEDCNQVRFLLENLDVNFHERDISKDLGYREELWKVLVFRAIPPRLFITGWYIGGAEEVVGLHECGRLRPLVRQFLVGCNGASCEGCGGMKFMLCSACNGSHSLYHREEETGTMSLVQLRYLI
jgi:glutaredoxin domain-containing cysteine-rich protein 1